MSYLQFGIGLGFVMAMVMGLMALDVDATSIEYYATVAEPMCELNYAKFGLGYYDVVEGFGDEAPLGELIIIHYTGIFGDGIVFDSSYKRGRPLTMRIEVGKIKCYMQQLLRGLEHCHSRGVMNRDIKGSNLLLDNNGNMKIADFRLATNFQPSQGQPLTRRVVTLPGNL